MWHVSPTNFGISKHWLAGRLNPQILHLDNFSINQSLPVYVDICLPTTKLLIKIILSAYFWK